MWVGTGTRLTPKVSELAKPFCGSYCCTYFCLTALSAFLESYFLSSYLLPSSHYSIISNVNYILSKTAKL